MNNKLKVLLWKIKRYPFISISIAAINLLVFLLCKIFPAIYSGGYSGIYEVLYCKEYGRIIWSMFLHSDAEHIFNNMIIVVFLGSILEEQIGHFWYGLIYFISGIGANIFSLAVKYVNYDFAGSLGASGAVFGLDGLLLATVLFMGNRLELPITRVILVIFLSVYSGFTSSGIDNAAHVGGLVLGFLLGILLSVGMRAGKNKKRRGDKQYEY